MIIRVIRLSVVTPTANHIGLQVVNSNTADSFGMVVKGGNDANDYTADFRKRDNTNIMRIRGDGNVGIGNTNPSSLLSVGDVPIHAPGAAFTSSPSSFFSTTTLGGTIGNSQKIAIFGGGDASNVSGLSLYRYRRATGTNWTTDGFSLRQEVDGTENIYDYINFSAGNVGIGTPSPAHPFHITKELAGYQAYFNNDNGSAQGIKVRIKSNDSGNFNMLELVSASTGSDVTAMVVRDDGNVGIGPTGPLGRLDIDSGSYTETSPAIMLGGNIDTTGAGGRTDNTRKYASIVGKHFSNEEQPVGILGYDCQSDAIAVINYGVPSNHYNTPTEHRFFTASNATTVSGDAYRRMTINGAGNVGIGTSNPQAPLDITPDGSKKTIRVDNISQRGYQEYVISGTIGANAVTITMQCPSYFQAEVVATFQQSNGGTDMNVYYNGIWSNNHTTHLFKNKTRWWNSSSNRWPAISEPNIQRWSRRCGK